MYTHLFQGIARYRGVRIIDSTFNYFLVYIYCTTHRSTILILLNQAVKKKVAKMQAVMHLFLVMKKISEHFMYQL